MQLELVDAFNPIGERTWMELEQRHPRSFFVSWGWMENWLACLPRDEAPKLAILREDDQPIAAFFLKRLEVARLKLVGSRALFLNATGNPRYDNLCIEHNGLAGKEQSIGRMIDALPDDWDELFLPGLRPAAFGGLTESVHRGFRVRIDRDVPTYLVDLARVREQGYLPLLGSQTRAQLRRARREAGSVELEVATDWQQALAIFEELITLHQKAWRAKGEPGAFADPWFADFHRRLISRRFPHGEIQLARLRSERGTLGTLYNFVYGGRVLQYQSGLADIGNKHIKPGFLAHAAAIEHAANAGHTLYDFLAGDMRYKKSLSTDRTSMLWARVQRQRFRFLVEDQLRGVVRSLRARRQQQQQVVAVSE